MGKKGRRRVRSSSKKEIPAETGTENHLSSSHVQNGKSLRLSWPFGLNLIKAITLIVIIALAGEFVLRIPNVRRQLPPPVLGTGNLTFDVTWEYLQRTLELYGHVDCVFMGSSMIKYSIEPKLFQEKFREKSGHDIVCFNFGVLGMRASEAGFYKSLIEKFMPSFVVSEVTPLFVYERFLENRNSPLISESPWGRFQSGDYSVKGWLLTHSLLFRYIMKWNMWVRSPSQYRHFQMTSRNMTMDGFLVRSNSPKKKRTNRPIRNRIKNTLSGKVGNVQALDKWLGVFSGEAPVVFLEIPLRGKTGRSRGERDKKFAIARMLLRKVIKDKGGLLFSPGEEMNLDKNCWMSINHMNVQGAKLFTPAFADKLAEAISTGIFEWPGDKR